MALSCFAATRWRQTGDSSARRARESREHLGGGREPAAARRLRGSEKTPGGGFNAGKGTQNKATRCQNGLRWTVNVSGLALALATHRWPAPARFAALWGFVEPLVDASGHARLHHSCFLLEKWPKRQRISGASKSFGLPPIATSPFTLN